MNAAGSPREAMTADDLLVRVRRRYRRMTPAQALAEQAAGAILVDTRSAEAVRRDGMIPGAVHVPLSVLPWRVDPACPWAEPALADRSASLVLLCQDGYSSSLAVGWLLDMGFAHATDVDGGVTAWIAAGLPTMALHTSIDPPGDEH
jgi:rhodanese-related sulfurtransferase